MLPENDYLLGNTPPAAPLHEDCASSYFLSFNHAFSTVSKVKEHQTTVGDLIIVGTHAPSIKLLLTSLSWR